MAISKMSKVLVTVWRGEAADVLEAVQGAGIMQVLNAESAMITKEWPELEVQPERAREVEELVARLDKAIGFLQRYETAKKGVMAALAPRAVIDPRTYQLTAAGTEALELLQEVERTAVAIEKYHGELEGLRAKLKMLLPWKNLETPVEDLRSLGRVSCQAMLIPERRFEEARAAIVELGGGLQQVGTTDGHAACVVIALTESAAEINKALRSLDAEAVSFEDMVGSTAELIERTSEEISRAQYALDEAVGAARTLSRDAVKLGIMYDHCSNLLQRELANRNAPATDHAVFFEGWVRNRDYKRLEEVVGGFEAASVQKIEPAEGEAPPVEIENPRSIKPFEVITRLYGMPQHVELDPTALLAPFFAIFFALCLTDAGYGLILVAFSIWLIKRMQGDKKFMRLIMVCSVLTVVAGALTGGWFGDAAQQPAGLFGWTWLASARERLMWFDPLTQPMIFFAISIGLGYIHIMTGLVAAFVHNLRRGEYVAAVFDQLVWLVMLNSIALYFASGQTEAIPEGLGWFAIRLAAVPAVLIFVLSHREGGIGARLGMGAYNVFSTIFYLGDVLSYLRLMALGMVTGGLAMAVNVMAGTASEVPYVGVILAIIVLVVGHLFNTAINALGAFVHTLRLQFVEFFPKFLVGGGRQFEPLSNAYKHVYLKNELQ